MASNALLNTLNWIGKFLWNCLFIVSYPIITAFSLLFMGIIWLFSTLSRLLSSISTNKTSGSELKKPVWKGLGKVGKFSIDKLFVDDIMFGPTYYKFRSHPPIQDFENNFFGDFVYPCFDGVLLQKWNSTTIKESPDFTLVFLNGESGVITEIQRIQSFSWTAHPLDENQVRIKWFNGTEGGEVLVDRQKLNHSLPVGS